MQQLRSCDPRESICNDVIFPLLVADFKVLAHQFREPHVLKWGSNFLLHEKFKALLISVDYEGAVSKVSMPSLYSVNQS